MRLTGFSPLVRCLIKERAGVDGDYVRCEYDGAWIHDSQIQLHHRLNRGAGGSRRPEVNQSANGLALCLQHHDWCEIHREEARELGLLISKLGRDLPSEVPVLLHHGWVLLDDEGGYVPEGEAA